MRRILEADDRLVFASRQARSQPAREGVNIPQVLSACGHRLVHPRGRSSRHGRGFADGRELAPLCPSATETRTNAYQM